VAAAVRAIVNVQRALRADPALAREVGLRRFPAEAAEMIADLVGRDVEFYDPTISPEAVNALNDFSRSIGLLREPVAYDDVVATRFSALW
jgi:NitT/TauT family transport system substrate-binding protein